MNFGIGLFYGWIFILFYGAANLLLIKIYPKHYAKRLFTLPAFTNPREKAVSLIYAIIFNLTMVAACFLPLGKGFSFAAGLAIYLLSFVCILLALRAYAGAGPNKPVTGGIYKLSRHPQQVFTCTLLIGLGLMVVNPLITISGIIQLFLLYPSMLAQEKFCLEKYGEDYRNYLSAAPRYFLF